MDDEQLAEYLEIPIEFVPRIDTDTRATYERLAEVEMEISLAQAGLGEMPKGVIVCGPRQVREKGR